MIQLQETNQENDSIFQEIDNFINTINTNYQHLRDLIEIDGNTIDDNSFHNNYKTINVNNNYVNHFNNIIKYKPWLLDTINRVKFFINRILIKYTFNKNDPIVKLINYFCIIFFNVKLHYTLDRIYLHDIIFTLLEKILNNKINFKIFTNFNNSQKKIILNTNGNTIKIENKDNKLQISLLYYLVKSNIVKIDLDIINKLLNHIINYFKENYILSNNFKVEHVENILKNILYIANNHIFDDVLLEGILNMFSWNNSVKTDFSNALYIIYQITNNKQLIQQIYKFLFNHKEIVNFIVNYSDVKINYYLLIHYLVIFIWLIILILLMNY